MTNQKTTQHWMIMVGNQERISATHLPQHGRRSIAEVPVTKILPNEADRDHLRKEYAELIGRVLVARLPFLSLFKDDLQWHIPHIYSFEMAKQTPITPLGLFEADEKKLPDIITTLPFHSLSVCPLHPCRCGRQNWDDASSPNNSQWRSAH